MVQNRKLIETRDGSHSILIPELDISYHSIHGALQESDHVFILHGLRYQLAEGKTYSPLRILEIGLGTGLNLILSLEEQDKRLIPIHYTAIEPYPLESPVLDSLNYFQNSRLSHLQKAWDTIHKSSFDTETELRERFHFIKYKKTLQDFLIDDRTERFDLIYFDAFAPTYQPELWTKEIFSNLIKLTNPEGILVTYCSKSVIRRAMMEAGWKVDKPPGPRGKREMVRAIR